MNRKVKHNLAWELVTVLKTDFFHRWKLQEKSTFLYIDFLPSWECTAMQRNASLLPIIYDLHATACKRNVF